MEKIKLIIPSDLQQDFDSIADFEITGKQDAQPLSESYQMNLAELVTAENLQAASGALIACIGLLSNLNGVVNLIEKIRAVLSKKSNSVIKIQSSTKMFVLDKNSSPEQFKKLENFLNTLV